MFFFSLKLCTTTLRFCRITLVFKLRRRQISYFNDKYQNEVVTCGLCLCQRL
uniref:Uncharacterized protein n=1 Tax=Rhizophora mucronata TaxID=61149 RepID=A0A2P2QFX2_RHIMU